jgi:hypothetical protein
MGYVGAFDERYDLTFITVARRNMPLWNSPGQIFVHANHTFALFERGVQFPTFCPREKIQLQQPWQFAAALDLEQQQLYCVQQP